MFGCPSCLLPAYSEGRAGFGETLILIGRGKSVSETLGSLLFCCPSYSLPAPTQGGTQGGEDIDLCSVVVPVTSPALLRGDKGLIDEFSFSMKQASWC